MERLLLGASFVLTAMAIVAGGRANAVIPSLVAGIAVLLLAVRWLDSTSHETARWIREILPFALLLNIFQSLGPVITSLQPVTYDHLMIASDHAILGDRLFAALWSTHLPWPVTDVLTLAYASFYFLPFALYVWMAAHRHPERQWVITAIFSTFLVSYVGYLLFPSLGPRATVAAAYYQTLPAGLVGGPIRHILDILENTKVDAFPSGHTMVTLLTLYFVQRYRPAWLWFYIPCSAFLVAATMLLAYHYVTDVLVGVLLIPVGPWLARLLFPSFESLGEGAVPPLPGLRAMLRSRKAHPPQE
ncbi:MAG: phosphatase PAP2 family protein [Acidobacteria bacterium]|nr:phosphatase PAP2 family protein [Acidobacteriota bacterium]